MGFSQLQINGNEKYQVFGPEMISNLWKFTPHAELVVIPSPDGHDGFER